MERSRILRSVVALALLALGSVLLWRPTASIGALAWLLGAALILGGGAALLRARQDSAGRTMTLSSGAAGVALGLFVLLNPGLTVSLAAGAVGAWLVLDGLVSLAGARSLDTLDARIAAVASGVASVVFGALAFAWPDITLLVASLVLGARLIVEAALVGWRALTGRDRRTPAQVSGWRRWRRSLVAAAALVVAVGAATVSGTLREGSPVVDDFYAAPRDVSEEPGRLIRSEEFTRGVPEGARGWRILYTTTRGDGSPAVASGLVVVPDGEGPFPLIDWTHGTTGFAENCAPSLAEEPFESGALMVLPEVVEEGWALVATDYIGLGTPGPHPYLIGRDSAHASLDAVRAVRGFEEVTLSEQTVLWGHSQGGGAALWGGAVADDYAPELEIAGVAALAPAANLPALMDNLPSVTGGSVFGSFVAAAYAGVYEDITWDGTVRAGVQPLVREMSQRCLSEPGVLVSVLDALAIREDPDVFRDSDAFVFRLRDNIPPATISAPVLLAQGAADSLVVPASQDEYVSEVCVGDIRIDYRRYAGRDHVPLVEPDSPAIPELFAWTRDRLAGEPVPEGCTTTDVP